MKGAANLFVCCPFGDYEIDLDVESFSDEGSTREQRTAWEIENSSDEVLATLANVLLAEATPNDGDTGEIILTVLIKH